MTMMVPSPHTQNSFSQLGEQFLSGDLLTTVLQILFCVFLFLQIPVVIHLIKGNKRGAFDAFPKAVESFYMLFFPFGGVFMSFGLFWGSLREALFPEEAQQEDESE